MPENQAQECHQEKRTEQQKGPRAALQTIGQQKQNDGRNELRAVKPTERGTEKTCFALASEVIAEKRVGAEERAVVCCRR